MKRFCVTGTHEKHVQSKNNTTVVVQDPTNERRVWHDTVCLGFSVVFCVIVFEELTHKQLIPCNRIGTNRESNFQAKWCRWQKNAGLMVFWCVGWSDGGCDVAEMSWSKKEVK